MNKMTKDIFIFFLKQQKAKVHLIISQLKKSTTTQSVLYIQSFRLGYKSALNQKRSKWESNGWDIFAAESSCPYLCPDTKSIYIFEGTLIWFFVLHEDSLKRLMLELCARGENEAAKPINGIYVCCGLTFPTSSGDFLGRRHPRQHYGMDIQVLHSAQQNAVWSDPLG